MTLDDLCAELDALAFPRATDAAPPDRPVVLAARESVGRAVADDGFLASCIARELELIAAGIPRAGLVPFFVLPGAGVRIALGYWAPGSTPGPHEHTAWTITAVCRNELQVVTYDYAASYASGDLVPKHTFHATAGRVGYIYEPCIHAPQNVSADWSLSLHVTSPRDGARPPGNAEPHPLLASFGGLPDAWHPYLHVVAARQRVRSVHQLAHVLATLDASAPKALVAELLDRCCELGSDATRRLLRREGSGPRHLVKVADDVHLACRSTASAVVLEAEGPMGTTRELQMSDIAREALAFAVAEPAFEIDRLPGDLSRAERAEIGDALENTGLFRRAS